MQIYMYVCMYDKNINLQQKILILKQISQFFFFLILKFFIDIYLYGQKRK